MLFKSETMPNNDCDKNFAWIIFADRGKIQTLWVQFFEDLLKNEKSSKINPLQN